jgi:hypothetical protein
MALKKPIRKLGLPKKTVAKASARPTGKGRVKAGGAFDRIEGEKKRWEAERNKPWEVSVPIGGTLDVYILDEGEPFYTYQHDIGGGPNQRAKTYPCLQDTGEPCPLCQSEGKAGYFILYYTAVIPVEKYTKQDGTEVTRRFQKKLFPIKIKMMEKYKREFIRQGGSMRGVRLRLIRDSKMDPKTGNDFEVLGKLSEAQIKAYANGEVKNKEGKNILDKETRERVKRQDLLKPFDYNRTFPVVDAKTLSQMAGRGLKYGGEGLGSADFDDDDDSDDTGWGEE